jgi:hypothetical protein
MFARPLSRSSHRIAAAALAVALHPSGATAAPAARAAGTAVPAILDFDGLGTGHTQSFRVTSNGGRLTVATSNPAIAKVVPHAIDARAGLAATFSVVPVRAGTARLTIRGPAGRLALVTVRVTTATLVLHDVFAATRSLRIETYRFADGRSSVTTLGLDPRSPRPCALESGGRRCTVTVGATAGAARLRVTFLAERRGRVIPYAITQRIVAFAPAADTPVELSNAAFEAYFPVSGTPVGSVAAGPPGDPHVWFVTATATGARLVKSAGRVNSSYPVPKIDGSVTLARGASRYLWFALATSQPAGSLAPSYVGAVAVGGATSLWTTAADPTCGVRYAPLSIAVGPDGNPWFLETLCRTIGVGTLANGTQLNYPFPQDIAGNAMYAARPAQHEIATGADGTLWFFVRQCGLQHYACDAALPARGAIGHITTRGGLRFFTLPSAAACADGFLTPGGDGNIWFAQPCAPAGAAPYVASTVGRIDAAGHVTEFAGLGSVADDIAEGPDGNVYLATSGSVARVLTRGTRAGRIDEYLSRRSPAQLTSVGAGPDGFLYATDALGRYARISVPSHVDR